MMEYHIVKLSVSWSYNHAPFLLSISRFVGKAITEWRGKSAKPLMLSPVASIRIEGNHSSIHFRADIHQMCTVIFHHTMVILAIITISRIHPYISMELLISIIIRISNLFHPMQLQFPKSH